MSVKHKPIEKKAKLRADDSGSALRIEEANPNRLPQKWHEEADVVIIGSGFAGLAAAIEARNAGASVVILEKMKSRGGNSIISDGLVAAASSALQMKNGIKDSPELMFEDMLKAGLGLNHPDLVKIVTEKSPEAVQWTIDYLGVQYKNRLEQLGGHTVPRSHITSNRSGSSIIRQMLAKAKELGIKVRTQMYLERFIQDMTCAIIGVRIRNGYVFPIADSGKPIFVKARKAVILATGGFASDVSFRAIQDPRLTEDFDSTNKPGATAEALKEALRIGATSTHLSWIQLGPWTSPDEKMYGTGPLFADYIAIPFGVMIDPATGKRFVNELADRKIRTDAILELGKPCIGIADAHGVEQSGQKIDKCLKRGVVKNFDDLAELAKNYSIPLKPLKETIEAYNQYVLNKRDKAFGKPILKGTLPLIHKPFYGIRLWPKVHYTMGGIRINPKAQVMNLNDNPIQGLYAAGEVTGGIHGACRLGSCAITDCLVFGRIAGKNAAAEWPK